MKPALLRQVASPVRWTDGVRDSPRQGATSFVEVGPGRVLTGLLKRIVDGARGTAVSDPGRSRQALAAGAAR